MGRRAVLVLGLVIVGAVAAVGVALGGLPRTDPARPAQASTSTPPPREPRQVFTLSVDLTRSGVVWLTTAGADCGGCVVVWRRTPDDDAWVPLRQVGSDHRPGQIRMADGGADGLIGGAGLWVTHDGGDSWNVEPGVPVASDAEVQAEIAGPHAWALVRRPGSAPVLWRAPLDGTDWRAVSLAGPLDPDAAPVAVGDALLLWVAGDPDPEAVVTRDGGRTWQALDPPCARGGGQVGHRGGVRHLPAPARGWRRPSSRTVLGDLAAGRRAGSGREPVAPVGCQQLRDRARRDRRTSSSAAGCWSAAIGAAVGGGGVTAAHGVAGGTTSRPRPLG